MSPRLAFALDAAFRAGRSTLSLFQTGTAIELKEDETPVTLADKNAERMIRELIEKSFPHDKILGEEEGGDTDALDRWVIDPIDGTKSFVSGVPLYGTLIAYEQDGVPILGVSYFPALDQMFYAEVGGGAFVDGRPCHVSGKTAIRSSVLSCGGLSSMLKQGRWDTFAKLSLTTLATRSWSDAYGHCLVASGRIEGMVDPIVNRWDISAIKVIVEEAGGHFTDFKGRNPFDAGNFQLEALCSNGWIHEELLAAYA
jgi:histidinol phosphatase-like enzyme (inositol monophosphatase family)